VSPHSTGGAVGKESINEDERLRQRRAIDCGNDTFLSELNNISPLPTMLEWMVDESLSAVILNDMSLFDLLLQCDAKCRFFNELSNCS